MSDGFLSSPWYPSPSFFDFYVPESRVVGTASVEAGITPTTRFVVLQDSSLIWRAESSDLYDEHGSLETPLGRRFAFGTFARRNGYIRTSDGLVRSSPGVFSYRGFRGYSLVFTASQGFMDCNTPQNSNSSALPDLTRIPGTLAGEEP